MTVSIKLFNLARRRIETICGQLRLGPDVAVSAFRYYQSALFRGLTRGRSAMQLAAACIYVAARQLRVNLMLLDLSDAVAINVYQVGRTYVDIKRRLNLSLPEIGKLQLLIINYSPGESNREISQVLWDYVFLICNHFNSIIVTYTRPYSSINDLRKILGRVQKNIFIINRNFTD